MIRFKKLYDLLVKYFSVPYFGFIQGHSYLTNDNLKELKKYVGSDDVNLERDFENNFSNIVGKGHSVCFAAGRMGFYALMKTEGVGADDEVILQGATCSVMVNAILRLGAIPVYADIDPSTFGSSAIAIREVLSSRTKMIVAQHSFGIPCDIKSIVELAKKNNIFLLEDCALTLGSTYDGVVCGNFGDAALFSTDHSKPLNTLVGGLIYTQNIELYKKLKIIQKQSDSIPKIKQKMLWKQLLFERKYCRPDRYGSMLLINAFRSMFKLNNHPFLDEDFGSVSSTNSTYPYPAKLPPFLAALGLQEIKRWNDIVKSRKELLQKLLKIISNHSRYDISSAYYDSSKDIVPLRLAWAPQNGENMRNQLSKFTSTSWTWFMEPIVATSEPLYKFGYKSYDCPISEKLGRRMVNLPCNLSTEWANNLQEKIENSEDLWD